LLRVRSSHMPATSTAGGPAPGEAERIEFLYFDGCPSTRRDAFLPRLRYLRVSVLGSADRASGALASGIEVFAMCAIDALGIAFMLDQPTTVHSSDPQTGDPFAVTVDPADESEWTPAGAGVVLASTGAGDSASCICPNTNFAASLEARRALVDQSPGVAGHVLSMADAIATCRDTFAEPLASDP
jgi:Alkylmercury lyase